MRNRLVTALLAPCLGFAAPLSGGNNPGVADTVLVNAVIRTIDPAQPRAEALAVQGNRILAVGTDAALSNAIGPETRIINAQGRLVLPGFNDAHVHFLSGGFQLSQVQLRDAQSTSAFTDRLRSFATSQPPGAWITGGDWDHERWPGAPLPTKHLIDDATTNHPVFVRRLDGHMAVANSRALQLAGITPETTSPPGGEIVRNPQTGEPTGLLKDAAMDLVYRLVPEPSFDKKLQAARAATDHAASLGVTSVHDMSAGNHVGVYQTLLQQGRLKTRIYALWPLPRWNDLAKIGLRTGFGNDLLRIGGLKGFSDGSLGASTALFFEPYLDNPNTRGLPSDEMFPENAMLKRVRDADQAGLQVVIHAIGDQANHIVLSIFEQVIGQNDPRDRRFRIEHAQHLRPQDIPRFSRSKIIASMQPYHAADDGRWAEKRIGKTRSRTTYPFRSLLDNGVALAFGSDWTVAPLNPIQGIAAAVTRRTLDGQHPNGWFPEQKITVHEAVRAYTAGSAHAEFADHLKGTITPGKLADLVVLSQDLFTIPDSQMESTRVLLTMCDGRIVYRDPAMPE